MLLSADYIFKMLSLKMANKNKIRTTVVYTEDKGIAVTTPFFMSQ